MAYQFLAPVNRRENKELFCPFQSHEAGMKATNEER